MDVGGVVATAARKKTPAQNQAHSAGEVYGPHRKWLSIYICMINEMMRKRIFDFICYRLFLFID